MYMSDARTMIPNLQQTSQAFWLILWSIFW